MNLPCVKCGLNPSIDNSTLCQPCIDQFGQFHVKIMLEDVYGNELGIVRDAQGCDRFLPPESPIIGYWVVDDASNVWVTLMSSVQAMQDSLTLAITAGTIKVKKEKVVGGVKREKKIKEVPVVTPTASREDQLAKLRALFPKKQVTL
jgi:hypothetical protein